MRAEQRCASFSPQRSVVTRTSSTFAARKTLLAARGDRRLRAVDRTLGVALLFVAGLFRRKRRPPATIRSIGLLKSTAVGDMILLSAVARDVVAAFPDATVVVLAGRDNADVAQLIENVEVVTL